MTTETCSESQLLAVDTLLAVLVAPDDTGINDYVEDVVQGRIRPILLDLTLYYAFASLRDGDKIHYERFTRFLQQAVTVDAVGRPEGPLPVPSMKQIEHWREIGLGETWSSTGAPCVVVGNGGKRRSRF